VIFGASSFAGPLLDLKSHVRFVELYIPKLGIYRGPELETIKIEKILDEISVYELETTIHAPYSAADPKYPSALQVDTAKMEKREFSLMEESIALASRMGATVVVIHPGRIGNNRTKSFEAMIKNLSCLAGMAEEYGVFWAWKIKKAQTLQIFAVTQKSL
jgi:sugar phosphate isomerase/epimerase